MSGAIAVLRVRGRVHVKHEISDNMRFMGLTRKNYCTILPDNEQSRSMIHKSKDYLTWGETGETTMIALIKERGRIAGDARVTDQYIKENSKFADIKSLAAALAKGETRLKEVKGMKSFFRLNPPRKGFEREGIKQPFNQGGALGNRKDKINQLVERML